MTIEFPCPECDSYLRTAEDKAGLRIRCPACELPIWVPHPDQLLVDAVVEEHGRTSQNATSDAYRDSDSDLLTESSENQGPENLPPPSSHATLGKILQMTWQVYTDNIGRCLVISIVDTFLCLFGLFVVLILAAFTLIAFRDQMDLAGPAVAALTLISLVFVYSAISIRNFHFFMGMARGETVSPGSLKLPKGSVSQAAIAGICFWIIVGIGLMMAVLPGLLAMLLLWPYLAFIVDRNYSATRSLREAYRITSQNLEVSVGVFLIHIVLVVAAGSIPLIGQFLALPLAAVLHSVSYLHLTGEFPTSEEIDSNL